MHTFFSFLKKKESYYLLLILILAAFLRLYRIRDYLTFLGDEGRDVLVVYNILHGHLTLLGPTSSVGGFFLGPAYYYLIAPFLWLFRYDPVGPAVMVGLFGTATVWLVYWMGTKFFGKGVGYLAAILYAISPLVIEYSRSSWNPNVVPFFALLLFSVLYLSLSRFYLFGFKLSVWILFGVVGFLFGIMMQLHYLATFLGAVIIFYIGISLCLTRQHGKTKQKNMFRTVIFNLLRGYSGIFIGFLVGFSPYLAFEARHGFPNTKSILTFIFHSKDVSGGGNYFLIVGDVFFRLFGRLVTFFPAPEQFSWYPKYLIGIWFWLTLALALLSFGYFLLQFWRILTSSNSIRNTRLLQYLLLFLWFALCVLLFGLYKKNIYDYYFTILFPVPFFFVASFLRFLWGKGTFLRILSGFVFVLLFILNLQGVPFRYPANRQLQQTEDIAKFVLDKTNNKPFNFALITGGNSDHAYRYFFTIWGHPSTIIDNPIHDPHRTSVTDQLLVVCESLPCSPLGNSLFEVAGFGRAEIVGKWDVSVVQVYKLRHYTGK